MKTLLEMPRPHEHDRWITFLDDLESRLSDVSALSTEAYIEIARTWRPLLSVISTWTAELKRQEVGSRVRSPGENNAQVDQQLRQLRQRAYAAVSTVLEMARNVGGSPEHPANF